MSLLRKLSMFVVMVALVAFTYGCGEETTATEAPSSTSSLSALLEEAETTAPTPAPVAASSEETAIAEDGAYIVQMGSDSGALKFVPATLTVQVGDTIRWDMNKMAPHNVVFSDDALAEISHEQLMFGAGDDFEVTVTEDMIGEHTYYCQPHRGAGMVGTLMVEAADA